MLYLQFDLCVFVIGQFNCYCTKLTTLMHIIVQLRILDYSGHITLLFSDGENHVPTDFQRQSDQEVCGIRF